MAEGGAVKPCCATHAKHGGKNTPARPDDRRCPLCQNSVLLGKAVDNSHHDFRLLTPCPSFCILPPPSSSLIPRIRSVALHTAAPLPGEPRTLLDLHCALLL